MKFLDLWQRPEKSYEIGSVHPSVLPSGHFLGIVSLIFSKFGHSARNPYKVVCDRTRFSVKNVFAPKIGKMVKMGVVSLVTGL